MVRVLLEQKFYIIDSKLHKCENNRALAATGILRNPGRIASIECLYFRMEYNRGMEDIPFRELQARLIARIRHLIRNGASTERRMGKLVGISQPHIHHVLKGARNLSQPASD